MARQARSLSGKVVVVTGGGRGIGAATAQTLVREGAQVAIADLDLDRAKETAAALEPQAVAFQLDVSDRHAFTAFLDQVERELGPIYALVNNAGIMPLNRIEEESDRTTAAQIAVNLVAVIHGTKEAVRRMKPRGTGHVVNVSSAAGKIPVSGAATYAATKFGVSGFTESLNMELKGTGVDVSCVYPAIVHTELSAGLKQNKGVRGVEPEEVAEAIVGALKEPRLYVYVPRSLGTSVRTGALIPRRVGEWLNRVLGGETMLTDAMHTDARAQYEARVSHSAPASDREVQQ
ncbi:MAG TPA: SDR family oxidoreductase [Nocardioidaceae bacterium]|nr:SDR family oxidoreductase [Nocardioidaceae bacterium]